MKHYTSSRNSGTNTEGDIDQMNATAKLLNGKNVAEILALADSIAQKAGELNGQVLLHLH